MKTIVFALLLLLAIGLACVCGYLRHSQSDSFALTEIESRAISARDHAWMRDQLEWDLRTVCALDQGKTNEIRSWANLRLDYWMINRAGDSRPHSFPHESDGTWVLDFLVKVARQRTQYPVSHDDVIVDETIANILKHAVELREKTERRY